MASVAASSGIPEVHLLDRYEPLIGVRRTERLIKKTRALADLRVLHVNSTRNGGGVAEILSSLVPLMNAVGITTDWEVIDGPPEFFGFTKELHNGLHGEPRRSYSRESKAASRSGARQRGPCRARL
jgi:trehalose synthase